MVWQLDMERKNVNTVIYCSPFLLYQDIHIKWVPFSYYSIEGHQQSWNICWSIILLRFSAGPRNVSSSINNSPLYPKSPKVLLFTLYRGYIQPIWLSLMTLNSFTWDSVCQVTPNSIYKSIQVYSKSLWSYCCFSPSILYSVEASH